MCRVEFEHLSPPSLSRFGRHNVPLFPCVPMPVIRTVYLPSNRSIGWVAEHLHHLVPKHRSSVIDRLQKHERARSLHIDRRYCWWHVTSILMCYADLNNLPKLDTKKQQAAHLALHRQVPFIFRWVWGMRLLFFPSPRAKRKTCSRIPLHCYRTSNPTLNRAQPPLPAKKTHLHRR